MQKELKRAKPQTVQNTIRYKYMHEDGICEIVSGFYSKTIKFSDINYQAARRDDQVGIFTKYCEIMNYFGSNVHLQISVVIKKLDPENFRKKMLLEKQGDGLDEYREEGNQVLLENVFEGKTSTIRERYLTFSVYADNYNAAATALARIETDIYNNFKILDSELNTLTGLERLSLLHDTFNPEEKFTFLYDHLVRSNLHTKDFISPDSFDFSKKRSFEFGNRFGQVLILKDLPPDLSDEIISDLSDIPANMSINLHIDGVEQDEALDIVKGQISLMEMQKIDEQKKAIKGGYDPEMIPHELRRSLDEAEDLLNDLQNKNQRMFKVTVLIAVYAATEYELADIVKQVSSTARKKGCKIGFLDYQQEDAMNSSLPLGLKRIEIQRTLTTSSTAIFIPFTTQELYHSGGTFKGINAISRNPVFLRIDMLKNGNGFILGQPGSGKSVAAKHEIYQILLSSANDQVFVIDPEREYSLLANALNGTVIEISAGSKTHINPMDITLDYADDDNPLILKLDFVYSLCEMIMGTRSELSPEQKSIIDRCVNLTYADYFKNPKKSPMPTLLDFANILKSQSDPEIVPVYKSMELYTTGTLATFAKPTNIDPDKRFIVYDTKNLGKSLKTIGLLVVLDQIWNQITRNRAAGVRTWVFIDEMHLLFKNEYSAMFLCELYKRARKWNAKPIGVTQNVEELLLSDTARLMLSNSEYIFMLSQATSDRVELAQLLNISPQHLGYVTNSNPGQGLLFAGNAIVPVINKIPKHTKMYKLMTTKPEDIQEMKEQAVNM